MQVEVPWMGPRTCVADDYVLEKEPAGARGKGTTVASGPRPSVISECSVHYRVRSQQATYAYDILGLLPPKSLPRCSAFTYEGFAGVNGRLATKRAGKP